MLPTFLTEKKKNGSNKLGQSELGSLIKVFSHLAHLSKWFPIQEMGAVWKLRTVPDSGRSKAAFLALSARHNLDSQAALDHGISSTAEKHGKYAKCKKT